MLEQREQRHQSIIYVRTVVSRRQCRDVTTLWIPPAAQSTGYTINSAATQERKGFFHTSLLHTQKLCFALLDTSQVVIIMNSKNIAVTYIY